MSPKGNKYLVIVESPAKARTIGKYLGSDYEVAAFSGDWLRTNWVPWFETIGYNDDKPVQPVFVCRAKPA